MAVRRVSSGEGLATYLQLALFPEAMDRAGWLPLLRGLRPGTPFAPLDGVLEGRAELRHYAQLASVIGFLVAERPGWLGEIALATARGEGLVAADSPLCNLSVRFSPRLGPSRARVRRGSPCRWSPAPA